MKTSLHEKCSNLSITWANETGGHSVANIPRFKGLRTSIFEAVVPDVGAINLREYADARDISRRGRICGVADDAWRPWKTTTETAARYDRAFFRFAPRIESWSHYGCVFIILNHQYR